MNKEKTIFAKWLAVELIRQGFPVLRTEQQHKNPQFYCWVFEETPEFLTAFANTANLR